MLTETHTTSKIFKSSNLQHLLHRLHSQRAYAYVTELNPKTISSLLKEEIALIAKVTLALQEPVCVNSYLPIPSGMIQLIQLFPQLGFASPNQQFSTVFLSSYCAVAALVHYWAHAVLSSM